MNPTIERLKLIFLGVFGLAVVGVVVWTMGWAIPGKKCAEARKWWDPGERVCAQPVLISDITGRTIQDKQAEAAARAAIGRPAPQAAPASKQP
ncbi:hypothetical protein ACO2Q0_10290 [Phenylobacterium sp. VNQ135]|uniref:hypothetical protein n=1 Tax=Phenylobacterium sp. VNQ135 TaxID=3400922 RepID=UPI003C04BE5C